MANANGVDEQVTQPDDRDVDLCDFCRLPISKDPVVLERDGENYEFCTEACRDAMLDSERVCTEYHGFRRTETGIDGLDRSLPEGLPRNSFILLSHEVGSRVHSVLNELVWRALKRGEPAVVVTFTEPPISVVEQFLSLNWNVLPYLEDGQLNITDCFTYRMHTTDRERLFERMDSWNRHVHHITENATRAIRDPTDVNELQNKLDNCLKRLEMSDRGVVAIDSLTEFGTLVQPTWAYDFVKDVRADVCKGRFVPIFAGSTTTGDDDLFPQDLGYVVDGIIDMQLNDSIVKDALVRRIRVRKMDGVLTIPAWSAYEFTPGKGLVTFEPEQLIDDASDDGEEGPPEPTARDDDSTAHEDESTASNGGERNGEAGRLSDERPMRDPGDAAPAEGGGNQSDE